MEGTVMTGVPSDPTPSGYALALPFPWRPWCEMALSVPLLALMSAMPLAIGLNWSIVRFLPLAQRLSGLLFTDMAAGVMALAALWVAAGPGWIYFRAGMAFSITAAVISLSGLGIRTA